MVTVFKLGRKNHTDFNETIVELKSQITAINGDYWHHTSKLNEQHYTVFHRYEIL